MTPLRIEWLKKVVYGTCPRHLVSSSLCLSLRADDQVSVAYIESHAPNGPPFALVVMFCQIWTWGVLTSDSPFSLPGKRSRSIWWGSGGGGRWALEPIDS